MKWVLELKGIRHDREFDSPTEAAAWAVRMWPGVPEATIADDPTQDAEGWLVVPIQSAEHS